MKTMTILTLPGIEEWKKAARTCLAENLAPERILWNTTFINQTDLFADIPPPENDQTKRITRKPIQNQKVSKEVLGEIEHALCHSDPVRFDICYRILWRYAQGEKNILHLKTDDDVMALRALVKAVRRDAYKITAFLRFRETEYEGEVHFIAWYEPEHYTLELKLGFFTSRFKNMRWSILTPYRAAHWDKENLMLEDNPDPSAYPKDDKVEAYWLTYYANIFNPARVKKNAMLSQMPMKYWKNMPETALIPELLLSSDQKVRDMIKKSSGSN